MEKRRRLELLCTVQSALIVLGLIYFFTQDYNSHPTETIDSGQSRLELVLENIEKSNLEKVDFARRGITERELPQVNFDQARQLTISFDEYFDQVVVEPIEANQENLDLIVAEVYNYFISEGFASIPSRPPQTQELYEFFGENHLGVIGESNCNRPSSYIRISDRMENPYSTWFNDYDFMSKIIHEVAHHYQGAQVCSTGGDDVHYQENSLADEGEQPAADMVETTAQIAMIEILSALANEGNQFAFKSLLYELRNMSLDAAYLAAEKEGRLDEWVDLYEQIEPGKRFVAEAFMRDPLRTSTLISYSNEPILRLINAYQTGSEFTDLALPAEYVGVRGSARRYKRDRYFITDDFFAVLDNLEYMVTTYSQP